MLKFPIIEYLTILHFMVNGVENNRDMFKKCYDDLGCVEVNLNWYDDVLRPVNLKPLERHLIRTEFLFIKKNTCQDDDRLIYNTVTNDPETLKNIQLPAHAELIMLIHDFTSNGYTGWIRHISQLLLKNSCHSYAIVSVDWQQGAEPPFDQAIANARLVALEINYLLNKLEPKINNRQIHIIGHGVGAHIAGYVGMLKRTIYKITALDPTGTRFAGMPDIVKLNQNCASYVEVLHTDAVDSSCQGTMERMGHADFYINNAQHQPSCNEVQNFSSLTSITRVDLDEGNILAGCSHKRSFKYYIETIKNQDCHFIGIRSNSYQEFLQEPFTDLSDDTWKTIGVSVTRNDVKTGAYYLETNVHSPYCLYPYVISIAVQGEGVFFGYFDFMLIDEDDEIANVTEFDPKYRVRNFTATAPNSYIYYAEPPRLNKIKEAKLEWTEVKRLNCLMFCDESIIVKQIKVKALGVEQPIESQLCPQTQGKISNHEFTTLISCKDKEKI